MKAFFILCKEGGVNRDLYFCFHVGDDLSNMTKDTGKIE